MFVFNQIWESWNTLLVFLVLSGKNTVEAQITKQMFICVFDKFLKNGLIQSGNGYQPG